MSILKFKLTEEHIKLLKFLTWDEITSTEISDEDKYNTMGIILYGMPENFDPFEGDPFEWSEVQKIEMDELYSELITAIDIVLYTQTFTPGKYKTKFHVRDWKLIAKL